MPLSIRAKFNGEALVPEQPVYLQLGNTYLITVEGVAHEPHDQRNVDALAEIRAMATDMGVDDLSTNHDRYAHGPKPD
jgi:hypothetical protein